MKRIESLSLIICVVFFLFGCAPDLTVRHLGVNWDEANKKAKAEIRNKGNKNAGSFKVHIKGVEIPESSTHKPELSFDVARLNKGDTISLEADFAPLSHPDNNNLVNVQKIRVVADPENSVKESSEGNNVKEISISTILPADPLNTEGDELYSIYRKGLIT